MEILEGKGLMYSNQYTNQAITNQFSTATQLPTLVQYEYNTGVAMAVHRAIQKHIKSLQRHKTNKPLQRHKTNKPVTQINYYNIFVEYTRETVYLAKKFISLLVEL